MCVCVCDTIHNPARCLLDMRSRKLHAGDYRIEVCVCVCVQLFSLKTKSCAMPVECGRCFRQVSTQFVCEFVCVRNYSRSTQNPA